MPHSCSDIARWVRLEFGEVYKVRPNTGRKDGYNAESFAAVTDQFAPLMKRFRIFFFWEGRPTDLGHWRGYIVAISSAAPLVGDTERSGIDATHNGMVKFSTDTSSGYRTVVAALKRYSTSSLEVLSGRWKLANAILAQTRLSEAFELAGSDVDARQEHGSLKWSGTNSQSKSRRHRHFYPPQQRTNNFIGRDETFETLRKAFYAPGQRAQQERFVVYGMGGSGKTEFCSKFARDNQEQ